MNFKLKQEEYTLEELVKNKSIRQGIVTIGDFTYSLYKLEADNNSTLIFELCKYTGTKSRLILAHTEFGIISLGFLRENDLLNIFKDTPIYIKSKVAWMTIESIHREAGDRLKKEYSKELSKIKLTEDCVSDIRKKCYKDIIFLTKDSLPFRYTIRFNHEYDFEDLIKYINGTGYQEYINKFMEYVRESPILLTEELITLAKTEEYNRLYDEIVANEDEGLTKLRELIKCIESIEDEKITVVTEEGKSVRVWSSKKCDGYLYKVHGEGYIALVDIVQVKIGRNVLFERYL